MLPFFIAIVCPQFLLHSSQSSESVFLNLNFVSNSNEQAKEMLLKLQKPIPSETKNKSFLQSINKNKWHITKAVILSSWITTQLTLLILEWKLKSKSCWSNKNELLTKNFLNKSKVKTNATEEIKLKLQTKQNIQEILSQIEREEKMLKLHNTFTKKISSWWLDRFFWFDREFTSERLLRLELLKKLLCSNNDLILN